MVKRRSGKRVEWDPSRIESLADVPLKDAKVSWEVLGSSRNDRMDPSSSKSEARDCTKGGFAMLIVSFMFNLYE